MQVLPSPLWWVWSSTRPYGCAVTAGWASRGLQWLPVPGCSHGVRGGLVGHHTGRFLTLLFRSSGGGQVLPLELA
jgi:hypothetical protein